MILFNKTRGGEKCGTAIYKLHHFFPYIQRPPDQSPVVWACTDLVFILSLVATPLLLLILPSSPPFFSLQWTLPGSPHSHKTGSMSFQAIMQYSQWLLVDWGWPIPGCRMGVHFPVMADLWLLMRCSLFRMSCHQMLGATVVLCLMQLAMTLLILLD